MPDRTLGAAGLRPGLALLVALALGASSCSYLGFVAEKRQLRRQVAREPSLALERELAPEGCFLATGELHRPPQLGGSLLVAAVSRSRGSLELVAARTFIGLVPRYVLFLPPAEYELLVVADLDGDGVFAADEVVARAPMPVDSSRTRDGWIADGPPLVADPSRRSTTDAPLGIPVKERDAVVASLEDPRFAPELARAALYRPGDLLARTQGLLFGLEPFDPGKTIVLFVHGALGTPRDFRSLVAGLDRSRYQPWFLYYPSGQPLSQVGTFLAEAVRWFGTDGAATRVVVVAHSMGGLVSRHALLLLTRGGRPPFLRGYVSLATPYGGDESAGQGAAIAPEVVPAWKDLAPASPFLMGLYGSTLPADLPFHLVFAWGTDGDRGPGPAGDGTVPLASQLHRKAQVEATRLWGFGATHVGILESEEARRVVLALLDEMSGAPAGPRG